MTRERSGGADFPRSHPDSLSHPIGIIERMNTPCPCGCRRRLPLDDHQIRHIAVHGRAAHEFDLAEKYSCAVSTIRHIREVWRTDGSIVR